MPDYRQPEHRNDFNPAQSALPAPSAKARESQTNQLYTIRRKGSRYNIVGPHGRVFTRYQSASLAGPRWEELTGTPWPYASSAYESGTRLWQLGLIERAQVGQRTLAPSPRPTPQSAPPTETTTAPAAPAQPVPQTSNPRPVHTPIVLDIALPGPLPLALPAPRIDLRKQARAIDALRRNPALLFDPHTRRTLEIEVEYHLGQARWAQKLLTLLARYEARQRRQAHAAHLSQDTILAKHIAWQEEQRTVAISG